MCVWVCGYRLYIRWRREWPVCDKSAFLFFLFFCFITQTLERPRSRASHFNHKSPIETRAKEPCDRGIEPNLERGGNHSNIHIQVRFCQPSILSPCLSVLFFSFFFSLYFDVYIELILILILIHTRDRHWIRCHFSTFGRSVKPHSENAFRERSYFSGEQSTRSRVSKRHKSHRQV